MERFARWEPEQREQRAREVWEHEKQLFALLDEEERDHHLQWVVVGGVALFAAVGIPYQPLRRDGTVRDIDVIVLADPEHRMSFVSEHASRAGVPLEVSFAKPITSPPSRRSLVSEILYDREGRWFLRFRDIVVPVSAEVFAVDRKPLVYAGERVLLPTFPFQTIVHLYLTRTAVLKQKDRDKLRKALRSFEAKEGTYRGCHPFYRPFHALARKVRVRYPGYVLLAESYHCIDAQLGGRMTHTLRLALLRRLGLDV